MYVMVSKEKYEVVVSNQSTTGVVDVTLTPTEAYNLYRLLQKFSSDLYDLAINYHECRDCGKVHHNDVKQCPELEVEHE